MPSFIEPTLFDTLRSERALPSPKGVRLAIMRLCAEDNPDMGELARLAQADPALSGRIIRIVNLQHASRVRPVAAVGIDVLLLIGLQSVRQLALALSLAEGVRPAECAAFDYSRFWSHSFAMAAAAQSIAEHTRVAPLAEMFTTGLLAGIGKLALACVRPHPYSSLLARGLARQAQLAMEQSLFGFNHLSLAAALMQDWRLPLLFCDAVLHHEAPLASGLDAGSRQLEIIWTLNLASAIAGIGAGEASTTPRQVIAGVAAGLARLQLSWDDFIAVYEKTGTDWKNWSGAMDFGASALWAMLPEGCRLSEDQADQP